MLLSVDGMVFDYGKVKVLNDVYLDACPSEILGILGPNGSGKTTMLKCINGILAPKQGKIAICGDDVKGMSRPELSRRIGYVPQSSGNDVCSPTVYEVVLMGRRPHVTWEYSDKDRMIAWKAMEEMDVKDISSQRFDRLSSGQAQRVLMARAIAQEVKVLLLDEPTSNLDVRYQIEVMKAVQSQVTKRSISACAVVHDLDLAMRFCDKVVLLNKGRVLAAGPTEDVLNPSNIKAAYGVESAIHSVNGRPRVLIM